MEKSKIAITGSKGFIKKNDFSYKQIKEIVPELGLLELYALESAIIKEFIIRGKVLQEDLK